MALGLGNVKLLQQLFKGLPVLRLVNGGAVGADDFHPPVCQRLSQVDGGLSSQGGNHPHRLLEGDNIHHILRGQGLKIQLVCSGIVRGHRLRVVVDDNGLVACLFYGHHRMDGGVIKLHTLADADGTGTQHHDFLFLRGAGLVLFFISGIEVRHIAFKLGGAGVNHLEHRHDSGLLPHGKDLLLPCMPQPGDGLISKAHALGPIQC